MSSTDGKIDSPNNVDNSHKALGMVEKEFGKGYKRVLSFGEFREGDHGVLVETNEEGGLYTSMQGKIEIRDQSVSLWAEGGGGSHFDFVGIPKSNRNFFFVKKSN